MAGEKKHTPGLARALSKRKDREPCECGFTMPVYPGAYPKKCPECGREHICKPKGGDDGESSAAD